MCKILVYIPGSVASSPLLAAPTGRNTSPLSHARRRVRGGKRSSLSLAPNHWPGGAQLHTQHKQTNTPNNTKQGSNDRRIKQKANRNKYNIFLRVPRLGVVPETGQPRRAGEPVEGIKPFLLFYLHRGDLIKRPL